MVSALFFLSFFVPFFRVVFRMICETLFFFLVRLWPSVTDNLGDQIDYAQKNKENLGDLIMETLEVLEMHGGPDAFINIKYLVPTYESALLQAA